MSSPEEIMSQWKEECISFEQREDLRKNIPQQLIDVMKTQGEDEDEETLLYGFRRRTISFQINNIYTKKDPMIVNTFSGVSDKIKYNMLCMGHDNVDMRPITKMRFSYLLQD